MEKSKVHQTKPKRSDMTKKQQREFYASFITRDIAETVTIREGTELDPNLSSESWGRTVWNRIQENSVAVHSLRYMVFIVLLAIFYSAFVPGSVFTTLGIETSSLGGGSDQYANLRHPFGTDSTGRDILMLLLAGSYTSMLVGIGSAIIFLIIGVFFGLVAGYYGGYIEEIIMRFTDFVLAIPFLLIAILALHLIKEGNSMLDELPTPVVILLILGLFGWAGTSRLVDATTKQVLNEEYIAAARTLDATDRRIILRHILPNILAPIIVVGTLGIATGILSEAGLTFLGFGNPATVVSWGTVLTNGTDNIRLHPQQTILAGFAVFFVAMAVNLLGDALRDALDPRLKR